MIIAIIGIDGCGKTTQAKMLVEKLEKTGYKCLYIKSIYVIINLISPKIKNFFSPRSMYTENNRKPSIKTVTKKLAMSLLGYSYALITYLLIRFESRNKIIVCDRWFYQFFFDLYGDMGKEIINFFPKADITFFIDGDLDTLRLRMDNLDKSVSKDYYIRVIDLYRELSKKYNFYQVDGHLDKITINSLIFNELLKDYE